MINCDYCIYGRADGQEVVCRHGSHPGRVMAKDLRSDRPQTYQFVTGMEWARACPNFKHRETKEPAQAPMDYDKIIKEIKGEVTKLRQEQLDASRNGGGRMECIISSEIDGLERAKHIVRMAKLTHGQGK